MSRKRILVADGALDIPGGLVASLVAAGYEVTVAHDGLQATKQAICGQPDLILLDEGLAAGPGHLIAERLRMIEATCRIPIIALDPQARARRTPAARGTPWRTLSQPLDRQTLLAAVAQELIERSRPH